MRRLFDQMRPFVEGLANKYGRDAALRDDLVQAGLVAVWQACQGFDPERGKSFTKYADPWITGGMKRLLASSGLVRLPEEQYWARWRLEKLDRRQRVGGDGADAAQEVGMPASLVDRVRHLPRVVALDDWIDQVEGHPEDMPLVTEGQYRVGEVRALVESYADHVYGALRPPPPAPPSLDVPRLPAVQVIVCLADLDRALSWMPTDLFRVVELCGLRALPVRLAARVLSEPSSTVDRRYRRGVEWATAYLNGIEVATSPRAREPYWREALEVLQPDAQCPLVAAFAGASDPDVTDQLLDMFRRFGDPDLSVLGLGAVHGREAILRLLVQTHQHLSQT
jgi:RNA polymerase sigma factor (sigma-70 family)